MNVVLKEQKLLQNYHSKLDVSHTSVCQSSFSQTQQTATGKNPNEH